jgi:hypothetical protein
MTPISDQGHFPCQCGAPHTHTAESGGRDDRDLPESLQRQKIEIASYNGIGLAAGRKL